MSWNVGKATEGLEHELWRRWSDGKVVEWAEQSSFSDLSITSYTSQLILRSFRRFTYLTAHSPTLPLLHLRHSSFSNPSFASPTSQALHLIHLASHPWFLLIRFFMWRRLPDYPSCHSIGESWSFLTCELLQSGREISSIILMNDCLCYKEPKSPYKFFISLIFNDLFKFKTSDDWQHWKTGNPTLGVEVQLAKWIAGNYKRNEIGQRHPPL